MVHVLRFALIASGLFCLCVIPFWIVALLTSQSKDDRVTAFVLMALCVAVTSLCATILIALRKE